MPRKTKTKTKPAARARTSPAAEAPTPAPQAAPVAAPAIVAEAPGYRTPPGWNRRDVNPRPAGPLTKVAVLVRGISWTISYSDGPLVLPYDRPVKINEAEFERLAEAVDTIDYDSGMGTRCIRFINKFRFQTLDGEAIELPPKPDVDAGEYAMSLGDRAERNRKFQGAEHTRR